MKSVSQVSAWGNSIGIRIPKNVATRLGIKSGDELEIICDDSCVREGMFEVKKIGMKPVYNLSELVEAIEPEQTHEL
jgi:antitoxin MazE